MPNSFNRKAPPRSSTQPVRDIGAKQSKARVKDKLRGYLAHHRSSLITSFTRLCSTPLQTFLTAMVVAIALALPATLLVVLKNAQQVGSSWNTKPQLSVYLDARAKDPAIEAVVTQLNANTLIQSLEYITPEQALVQFQQTSGYGDVLGALDTNPLPPTIIVRPASGSMTPSVLTGLAEEIKAIKIVEDVVFDMDWVRRLLEIMILGETIVASLAGLLGLGVLLAIGNTIRLAIENRRTEIVVSKLVGGTNAFVRRPFLYTGLLYGVFGGLLAVLIVSLTLQALAGPVARLALSYQSSFTLTGLGVFSSLLIASIGGLLGLLGAWLAVARELSSIEPR